MRVPVITWSVPLAAVAGYLAARWWPEHLPSLADARRTQPSAESSPQGRRTALTKKGAEAVPELLSILGRATVADLRGMAQSLLNDPKKRRDFGLWSPLLARWAEVDGAGLLAFATSEAPAEERSWLESKAWFAWGAARPAAAAEAGKSLGMPLAGDLIRGMAETDAAAAVKLALELPGTTDNIYDIAAKVAAQAPEKIEDLLPRSTYDAIRRPLRQARASALAVTNPAAAVAMARQSGNFGHDPVPVTVKQVARQDPEQAAALVAKMPSSRSKALSAVAVAKTWAEENPAAAASWTRQTLSGPVRQAALLEIAAASGGPDPAAAFQLVEEAGWQDEPDFFGINGDWVSGLSESSSRPTPARTAGLLLQQLAALDPAAAQRCLDQRVPADHRAAVARMAGLSLTPSP